MPKGERLMWATDVEPTRWGVHVHPLDDVVEHDITSQECVCGPIVEWVNPLTGVSYPAGPVVVHHSLDGRELDE